MRAIFTGGGTGGHIYPAVSVARFFIEKHKAEIVYIGSVSGMEKPIVEAENIPFYGLRVKGLVSKNPFKAIPVFITLIIAIIKSYSLIKQIKPDFIFATGGYVSAPVILASKILNVPLFIHEQNAVFGLTNRIGSRIARKIFTTFKETSEIKTMFSSIPENKIIYSGLPVRAMFCRADQKKPYHIFDLDPEKTTVLVTGGSRGARFINQKTAELYPFFIEKNIQVIHITGQSEYEVFEKSLASEPYLDHYIKRYPYLNNMYDALAVADICISRAGASFLAEMTLMGKPGVLIPFPYATHNHQLSNARSLEKDGVAITIEESDIEKNNSLLKNTIERLLFQPGLLQKMKEASKKTGAIETLTIIEQHILKETGVGIE